MRVTAVCLLTLALVASTMARGGQNDEECPASPSAQACAKSACKCASKNVAAASCPESSPNCPCETLTKAVAVAKAKCCAQKNVVSSCDAAKAKCCAEKAVAQACAAGQCCKKTEVAVAAGECEDCPLFKKVATVCSESACCKQAATAVASCEGAKCCAEKCGTKVAACGSESCDDNSECCVASETACDGEQACCTSEKIAHLLKAAEHLEAAGMIAESFEVRAAVQELRGELLAEKTAQLERLQAEVEELHRVAGRQVKVHVKIVKVPVDKIQQLGIDLSLLGMACNPDDGPPCARPCSREAHAMLEALHKAKVVDMVAAPTLVTVEGRAATFITHRESACAGEECAEDEQSVDTRLDFRPVLLNDNFIQLHVNTFETVAPPCAANECTEAACKRRAISQRILTQLGQTVAITAPAEHEAAACCKGEKSKDAVAHQGARTVYLITPELVHAKPPVSHTARPPVPRPYPVR